MSLSWTALHAHLLGTSGRLSFLDLFRDLAHGDDGLGRFGTPAALLSWLHGATGDADDKNLVLRSLCDRAQAPDRTGEGACVLLLLALWPGLDAIRGRLLRHYRSRPDELTADLAGGLPIGIGAMDLCRVDRIAATLLRNLERDLRRDLARRWEAERMTRPLDDIDVPVVDHEGSCRALADLSATLRPEDAHLLKGVAIEGYTQHEMADRIGISHDAARKRYQRALCRLREAAP